MKIAAIKKDGEMKGDGGMEGGCWRELIQLKLKINV